MNFNLDNQFIKYLIILIIIYYIVSKIPNGTIVGNNPFILTAIIMFVIYLLDRPNFLFEHFKLDDLSENYEQN